MNEPACPVPLAAESNPSAPVQVVANRRRARNSKRGSRRRPLAAKSPIDYGLHSAGQQRSARQHPGRNDSLDDEGRGKSAEDDPEPDNGDADGLCRSGKVEVIVFKAGIVEPKTPA